MAIKDIINAGIGFAPGGVKFVITRGLAIGSLDLPDYANPGYTMPRRTMDYTMPDRVVDYIAPKRVLDFTMPPRSEGE